MLRTLADSFRAIRHALGLGPQVDLFFREKFDSLRAHYVGTVLDFGAGTCFFAKRLQDLGYAVTAVDVVNENRYSDVTLRVIDDAPLPFATDAFDTSVAHFVLHHVGRQDEAFAELVRVTRGAIVVSEDVVDTWLDRVVAWLHIGTTSWARARHGFRTTRGWLDFYARFPVDVVEQRVIPRWRTLYYPVRRVVFVLRVRPSAAA